MPGPTEPMQSATPDYPILRQQLNDFESTFYGPHECQHCGVTIVRKAREQGGESYEEQRGGEGWSLHKCDPLKIEAMPRASDTPTPPTPLPNFMGIAGDQSKESKPDPKKCHNCGALQR